ncbi:MAG: YkgJ family cysteine cluster protein [Treponema sp.]|nr:YkgJ family cysteine cluster protein [Treponema sp.]
MSCFYDDGLNFSCQQCSYCCRIEPGFVYLSQIDLTNLCNWFKFSEEQFIKKYCRAVPYYDGTKVLCLKEKENYDCILWGTNGCTAYKSRPLQCSTYPFWSWILEDRSLWNEAAKDCPGINKGRLWTKDEIEEQKNLYDSIEPLRL